MNARRWTRRLARWLLAAGLVGGSGCLAYLHPVAPPSEEILEPSQIIPKCCRDHVYVFLANGMDPFYFGNMVGLRDYVQRLGFHKTFYGELYHWKWFKDQMIQVHHEDPEAHFVLIGFSLGGDTVQSLAHAVQPEGITIDLLIYLDPKTLSSHYKHKPDNVAQVINILTSGKVWNGEPIPDAENVREDDVWHFGAPSHAQTLELVGQGLMAIAETVPAVEPRPAPMPPSDEVAPTPRPVTIQPAAKHDEWDFLKSELNPPRGPAAPAEEKASIEPTPGATTVEEESAEPGDTSPGEAKPCIPSTDE